MLFFALGRSTCVFSHVSARQTGGRASTGNVVWPRYAMRQSTISRSSAVPSPGKRFAATAIHPSLSRQRDVLSSGASILDPSHGKNKDRLLRKI
jgi:hypothetical protein